MIGASASVDGVLVLTATAAALLVMSRRLPIQNVLLAGAVVALGGILTGLLAVRSGIWVLASDAGPRLFRIVPWRLPCLWVVAILASRGSAQYLLRSRQASARFGWEMLTVTTGLSLIPQAAVGRHAREHDYWTVPPEHALVSLGVCSVGTVLILLIVTPILINKKPVSTQPDYYPLVLWLFLTLLLLA